MASMVSSVVKSNATLKLIMMVWELAWRQSKMQIKSGKLST